VNKELTEKWLKDLCDVPFLAEMAKKRGFECNNELKTEKSDKMKKIIGENA
jgi:hypothetical protein